jgi:hypothetical protein
MASSPHNYLKRSGPIMSESTKALTLQLLEWISSRPRTYAEVLDAWRTTCPRLSIWEDACIDGLVDCGGQSVTVSPRGKLLLQTKYEDRDTRRLP